MDLPQEIPVMILPNIILFPQAMLPLHIFEPRYRQMLRDALDSHRMFSVALIKRERTEWNSPEDFFQLLRRAEQNPHGAQLVGADLEVDWQKGILHNGRQTEEMPLRNT